MTQDDKLNGRLICEFGIAPVRPAEFVIFRVRHLPVSDSDSRKNPATNGLCYAAESPTLFLSSNPDTRNRVRLFSPFLGVQFE
jgi:hypothetical protein